MEFPGTKQDCRQTGAAHLCGMKNEKGKTLFLVPQKSKPHAFEPRPSIQFYNVLTPNAQTLWERKKYLDNKTKQEKITNERFENSFCFFSSFQACLLASWFSWLFLVSAGTQQQSCWFAVKWQLVCLGIAARKLKYLQCTNWREG